MENTIKIKRTAITLAQKVQIILKLNDPSFKQKEIAREYGLTASAISKIVKKKEEILEEWLRGGNLERKRKREGKNQTIDDALLSWFWTASKEEGPISGPVLMAKAKALAEEMGIEFKPTNGWLCRWKNRNNLAYKRTPKEKGEPRTPDQWTGFPLFMPPSHYLQEGPHVADFYGDGAATQRMDEAEEDGPERSAGGTEEQESQFYLGAERFPPAPAVHQAQWQMSMTSDSSSDEMPATHPLPQQGAATPSKHKRIKQEQCSLSSPQPGHSCQFYTAPSDLRGQREMPGTSNEPATGIQSKGKRGKREEDHRSLSYQYYKSQPETVYTSDTSDTSSDETASARTIIHRATGSHHSKRIKQESSAQPTASSHSYSFYTAPEELRDARCAPCSSSSPSDEIMRTKTPIYRTVATRTRQERILQEEDSAPIGRPSQSLTSFKGKQTLSQVLHQLGAHRLPRGSFIEIPVTHPFDIPAETPHSPYGGHVREDSIPKRRNQFYKGENSRKAASSSTKRPDAMLRAQEESLKKSEQAVMVILRNVYFSGKEMLPNSSTEALNDLCLIQGVGDLSTLLSDKHMSYQADKSIGEFQQAMAEVIEEGILTRVQSANCFSILVDQSHSFPEQSLLLYVRIIEQVAGGYEPKTYFLALKQMGEATAGKITAEIAEMLKGKGLNVTKMCGMAIDGVSITTKNKHEVVTQLKARVPGILSIHCIAHRLALSSVSAADTVTYLVKYQHMLASVYKYFANVLASKEGLEAMLKILRDSEKQSSPFKETSPQWLTIRASIEAVIRNFGCLVSVLRSDGSAMAVGLAKSMCTYKFLHCSHFLADILHQLYILCKSYHTSRVDFSIAHSLLKSTVTTISKLSSESSGEMLKTFLAALPVSGWDDNASFFTYQSHQIKGGSAQRRAAESICRTFAQNLMEDLKARFSEPGDAVTMTAMTAIFDPAHASDFKSQHIQTVTNYLSSLSSESDKEDFEMGCKQELVSFMNFVESQPGVNVLTSAKDVCELALKQKLMFPTVSSLAERFLALPITTGELVKGFSREAALQSKLGNSLSSTSLENLLKISIHGPPIKEFSFRDAYLKWVSSKLDKTLKPKS